MIPYIWVTGPAIQMVPFSFSDLMAYTSQGAVEQGNQGPEQRPEIQKTPPLIGLTRADLQHTPYNILKKAWSEEQDNKLVDLLENQKLSWNEISREMGNRTYKMCYSRYKRIKLNAKNIWTNKEDEKLKELVEKFGKEWRHLVEHFPGRTSKQIRERYVNTVKPEVSKEIWTLDEDLQLIELINRHGKKWKDIENEMPHRSQNQLKNRYFSRLLKMWNKKKKKQRN